MGSETTWFTDGSCFIQDGERFVGEVLVSNTEIIWADPLQAGNSAQKAELIVLSRALELGKIRELHLHRQLGCLHYCSYPWVIYRERGLLTAEGKTEK